MGSSAPIGTIDSPSPIVRRWTMLTLRPRRLRHLAAWVVSIQVGVLAATGTWLLFEYRPEPAHSTVGHVQTMHQIHVATSRTLLPSAAVLALWYVIEALAAGPSWRRRAAATVAGVLGLVGVALASFSARLLQWDQVGLWSVRVGQSITGYSFLWRGEGIRFAIIDGRRIAPGTLAIWLAVHGTVVPAVGVLCVAIARRLDRYA